MKVFFDPNVSLSDIVPSEAVQEVVSEAVPKIVPEIVSEAVPESPSIPTEAYWVGLLILVILISYTFFQRKEHYHDETKRSSDYTKKVSRKPPVPLRRRGSATR